MSESNGTRRYFNLAGVVRDLEHASSAGATPEGRDLWERFVALADEAFASALDAESESEDTDESDHLDGDEMGDEVQQRSGPHAGGPGGDAASRDDMLSRLARLEAALAAQPGPEGSIQSGPPSVDGARKRLERRVVTSGKKSTKKSTAKSSKKTAR